MSFKISDFYLVRPNINVLNDKLYINLKTKKKYVINRIIEDSIKFIREFNIIDFIFIKFEKLYEVVVNDTEVKIVILISDIISIDVYNITKIETRNERHDFNLSEMLTRFSNILSIVNIDFINKTSIVCDNVDEYFENVEDGINSELDVFYTKPFDNIYENVKVTEHRHSVGLYMTQGTDLIVFYTCLDADINHDIVEVRKCIMNL